MSFTKFIVVVDEHVNVHSEQEVLFHLFSNCDPERDTEIVHGPVDILDHAAPVMGAGSKIGFDATAKWKGEGQVRMWPREIEMDQATGRWWRRSGRNTACSRVPRASRRGTGRIPCYRSVPQYTSVS
jgi:4-hydroxy-3-polyprenylbenzoate decarboxylase